VSDLIAKLKNGTPTKQSFCLSNEPVEGCIKRKWQQFQYFPKGTTFIVPFMSMYYLRIIRKVGFFTA
jgi:hypothetical protein